MLVDLLTDAVVAPSCEYNVVAPSCEYNLMKSVHEQFSQHSFAGRNYKQTLSRHYFSNYTGETFVIAYPECDDFVVFIDELISPYKEVLLMGHAHQSALVTSGRVHYKPVKLTGRRNVLRTK